MSNLVVYRHQQDCLVDLHGLALWGPRDVAYPNLSGALDRHDPLTVKEDL